MNIVTIDFDIIMAPSIESYNYFINEDGNNLSALESQYEHFNFCRADLSIYQKLTHYILYSQPKEIIFINHHGDIKQFITEKCNLINIDHHHDVGYQKEFYEDNFPDSCGNWVERLYRENKIESYTWVKNINSVLIDVPENKITNQKIMQDDDIDKYLNNLAQHTDKLIICSSFPWIASQYYDLFYTWKDICEVKMQTKISIQ